MALPPICQNLARPTLSVRPCSFISNLSVWELASARLVWSQVPGADMHARPGAGRMASDKITTEAWRVGRENPDRQVLRPTPINQIRPQDQQTAGSMTFEALALRFGKGRWVHSLGARQEVNDAIPFPMAASCFLHEHSSIIVFRLGAGEGADGLIAVASGASAMRARLSPFAL